MKTTILFPFLILIVLAAVPVHAQNSRPPIPPAPPDGKYVLDELDWLSDRQEMTINTLIRQMDEDEVAEIAVVTLNDCGLDRFAFRRSIFNTWGIGHASDHDGLLILVCWYDGDPSHRSVEQLYGPGLNRILTPEKTDQIAQEKFVPSFQEGSPGNGLVGMIKTYDEVLRKGDGVFTRLTMYFENLGVSVNGGWLMLVGAVFLLVLHYILPDPIRRKLENLLASRGNREYTDHRDYGGGGSDRGGGGSDGGGGSSTRF